VHVPVSQDMPSGYLAPAAPHHPTILSESGGQRSCGELGGDKQSI